MAGRNQAWHASLSFLNLLRFITLYLILSLTAATNYIGAQSLARPRALQLIQSSKEFREPLLVIVNDGEILLDPASPHETEEEARARALNSYYEYANKWAWAALKYLGYIDARATLVEKPHVTDRDKPYARLHPWKFRVEHFLTEKGKGEARRYGLTGDNAIPLAHKQVIAVTGMTTPRRALAIAEFTWKTVYTPAGEAFNPATNIFKSLPEPLQTELKKPRGFGIFSRSDAEGWSQIRRSSAYFQLYDDGWRLQSIR